MCIAIFKPKDRIIPEYILRRCMRNHDDGAGFAVIEPDEKIKGKDSLNIYKGYFDFANFWKAWQPHQNKQALLHFRRATHGLIDGDNCHPFRVNDDLVLIHNGRLPSLPNNDKISDTGVFVENIIAPFAKMNPDFWLLPSFEWFINNSITKNNKLVFMDIKGRVHIFNKDEGVERDGVWYSNWSFNHDKQGSWRRESWSDIDGCGDSCTGNDNNDVAEGEIIDNDPQLEPAASGGLKLDDNFETSDVAEIDDVLEKYQRKHGFVHDHLV